MAANLMRARARATVTSPARGPCVARAAYSYSSTSFRCRNISNRFPTSLCQRCTTRVLRGRLPRSGAFSQSPPDAPGQGAEIREPRAQQVPASPAANSFN